MADVVGLSEKAYARLNAAEKKLNRLIRRGPKKQGRWHSRGGSGGGEWVEGITENNDCPAGTIDILIDAGGTGAGRIGETITAVDRFNVMDGQTAAELEGNVALAARTYYLGEWIWRLWMIDSGDPCDEYA